MEKLINIASNLLIIVEIQNLFALMEVKMLNPVGFINASDGEFQDYIQIGGRG